jgi:MFS family permease
LLHLPQRWIILLILNAVYFFVFFHRVSTAVLAPYLMEEFAATAASLGAMSSSYFYPYALSQPLVGILTDRFGARKVITFSTFFGFGGALLFGLAPNLLWASFARGLIGFGAAGVFVPALKVLLPWFGVGVFAQMNTILLAAGSIGAITASTPYAWLLQQVGWRFSFFIIAALSFCLAILSWTYIRNVPSGYTLPSKEGEKSVPSLTQVFFDLMKTPLFWILTALFFTFGGPGSTFQALWGYPYLMDVFGYEKLQASNFLMIIPFGVILGGPILGYLTDKTFMRIKRPLLSVLIAVQVFFWYSLVFLGPSLGPYSLSLLFFFMGMTVAGTLSLIYSIVREESTPERLGTAIGFLNIAPFLGAATFQPLTGYLMDRVGKVGGSFPLEAYQHAFGLCLFSISISLMISFFLIRKRKKEVGDE